MNGKIEWDPVSFDSKKVFPLVTQLPLFKVMCKIDKKLKDSHKCDEGLKDFFYFCAQRNKDSGFVLLLYTAHEIPPDLYHSHICYFDSPKEFLSFVNKENESLDHLSSSKKVTSSAADQSKANLSDTKLIADTTTIISASTAFTASKPVAAQRPVHSDKKTIAEPFESQFKAKYGEELYEEIFQTFFRFDTELNKMNREIGLDKISFYPKKVYQLIKQLPHFNTICEIDRRLKDSNICKDGLKDFLCFCTERHKASGSILLLYTTHKIYTDLKYEHIRFFTSPQEFLSCVDNEHDSTELTSFIGHTPDTHT